MDSKDFTVLLVEQDLNQAKANLASLSELRPREIAIARAQVEEHRAAIKAAQEQLNLDFVRAPIDGLVLKIHTHEGETIDKAGDEVMTLLRSLAYESNTAIILVTHDVRIMNGADLVLHIEDGRLSALANRCSSRETTMKLTNTAHQFSDSGCNQRQNAGRN